MMMMMMEHAFIHVYYSSNEGKKKSTEEHAQTQMYVFKKTTYHTVRFDRNKKNTERKKPASCMTAWQSM
jgi:hypothetical protein